MKTNLPDSMANFITCLRILCAFAILFCPALSASFYILYISAGLTDMIDGQVARKTDSVSASGARLDTAADLIFVIVCLIKLLPVLEIPLWLLIWTAVIAVIRVINLASGFVMRKQFVALHTRMNKVSGLLLFILPLTLPLIDIRYSGSVVCAAAAFAAVQEGHFIRTGKE